MGEYSYKNSNSSLPLMFPPLGYLFSSKLQSYHLETVLIFCLEIPLLSLNITPCPRAAAAAIVNTNINIINLGMISGPVRQHIMSPVSGALELQTKVIRWYTKILHPRKMPLGPYPS